MRIQKKQRREGQPLESKFEYENNIFGDLIESLGETEFRLTRREPDQICIQHAEHVKTARPSGT